MRATWVLAVASVMTRRSQISGLERPCDQQVEDLPFARCQRCDSDRGLVGGAAGQAESTIPVPYHQAPQKLPALTVPPTADPVGEVATFPVGSLAMPSAAMLIRV
jgi:hypothetical protein